MDLQLSGRTALVTGSYRGTGRGIAGVLGAEGAHVIVHGFEPGQPDEAVQELLRAGHSAEGVVADIRTDQGAQALGDTADRIDIVVNNYGAPTGSSWTAMTSWEDEWNVNVLASVRVTQLCLPAMRERGWGRVVFLGTVGIQMPGKRNVGYYGAKTALPTLVRTLAMELQGTGVTANLVSPGMIATDEMREMVLRRAARDGHGETWEAAERWVLGLDEPDEQAGAGASPSSHGSMANLTERIARPEDIGRVVAFVASEAAWHMTGADIPIDGGARDARI